MKCIIQDWAGNRIKPQLVFNTFDDAWDFILGELTDEFNLQEEDYQEFYVEEVSP